MIAIAAAITAATLGITKNAPAKGDAFYGHFSKEHGFPLHYLTSVDQLPPCNSGDLPNLSRPSTSLKGKVEVVPVPSLKHICANDEGRLPGDTKLNIHIQVDLNRKSVSDPLSTAYNPSPSRGQFGEEYGAPAIAFSAITNWAKSYGLSAEKDAIDGVIIRGSATKIEKAFSTQFDNVRLQNFSPAYANVKPMYMPPSISQYISDVLGGDSLIGVIASPALHISNPNDFTTKIRYKNMIIDWLIWLTLVILIYLVARFIKKHRSLND